MERMAEPQRPWYSEGLRFSCTGCGDCCTGAPGYVWLRKVEIRRLADATGLDVASFEAKFVREVGVRKSLKERRNGDCFLFDAKSRHCTVYDARPDQCRTFPFWDSVLRSPDTWQSIGESCPGCDRGEVIPCEQIEAQRNVVRV
jgi:uncharacterized protein